MAYNIELANALERAITETESFKTNVVLPTGQLLERLRVEELSSEDAEEQSANNSSWLMDEINRVDRSINSLIEEARSLLARLSAEASSQSAMAGPEEMLKRVRSTTTDIVCAWDGVCKVLVRQVIESHQTDEQAWTSSWQKEWGEDSQTVINLLSETAKHDSRSKSRTEDRVGPRWSKPDLFTGAQLRYGCNFTGQDLAEILGFSLPLSSYELTRLSQAIRGGLLKRKVLEAASVLGDVKMQEGPATERAGKRLGGLVLELSGRRIAVGLEVEYTFAPDKKRSMEADLAESFEQARQQGMEYVAAVQQVASSKGKMGTRSILYYADGDLGKDFDNLSDALNHTTSGSN